METIDEEPPASPQAAAVSKAQGPPSLQSLLGMTARPPPLAADSGEIAIPRAADELAIRTGLGPHAPSATFAKCFENGQAPAEVTDMVVIPAQDGYFVCCFCGNELVIEKFSRIMSKSQGTMSCKVCACKRVALWRGFGKWPTKEFQALPIDAQKQFYNDIQTKYGAQAICAVAHDVLEGYEMHSDVFAVSGEWRPLGFWKEQECYY